VILEDEDKIALYKESTEKLNAIIGIRERYELDNIGKMAIISAVLKMSMPYFFVVAFYIACDPLTKSEIAVPVTRHNKLIAVLDVDSSSRHTNAGTLNKT
jgi:hypothetical protein